MPSIDWNAVQATSGTVPDTSVIRGTKAAALPTGTGINAGSVQAPVVQGLPEVKPLDYTSPSDALAYTPDYTVFQGLGAGVKDTAIGALWYAFEAPDFDYDGTFVPTDHLRITQDSLGRQFNDDAKSKLLRTGSKEEYDYQLQRIMDNETQMEIAGQELLGYIGGSIIDVDLLVGGALGKIPAVARAGKASLATVRAGGMGVASGGAYAADQYTALSPEQIAFQISVVTAGSLLLDTAFGAKAVKQAEPVQGQP